MRFGQAEFIDWHKLGCVFAEQTDQDQAEFFKGMIHSMNLWRSGSDGDMQLAHVNLLLTEEEKCKLQILGEL